ncbi:HD-GYP domain-containing protein [Oceanobacillus halotolerans]|uniref:HD-GYP domain-containing protein n=1 Tax=Oceanobacillus halotolerans TaxID=2663380 RepID=UPI0013D9F5EF|nr:HD domain-containing phosphohydrolase [Oceanobacillus halotolerans]
MTTKHVNDILPNEVLAEDLVTNNTLVLKKGTELTRRMIELIKKRNIKTVTIQEPEEELQAIEELEMPFPDQNKTIYVQDEAKVEEIFLHTLAYVGYEYRYGMLLNKEEDILFLKEMFLNIHQNYPFIDTLYALHRWDRYAFVHSFDVFVLGTLMAKKHNLRSLETIALGYLFHDIGKMNIPQEILHKERKLTNAEFELIKTHTTQGESILRSLGQDQIAHFARSHHERMDGSGYPDSLTEESLSKELRILQMVDVYSALTLKRAYKDELPAQEALQILFRDYKMFDMNLLYDFVDTLNIYPSDATVVLSDDTPATIEDMPNGVPTLPYVRRIPDHTTETLPLDFSVTISRMINSEVKSMEQLYNEFVDAVLNGQSKEAQNTFAKLIDGRQLEDVYTQIILPVYYKATNRLRSNEEFEVSHKILMDLLNEFEHDNIKLNEYHTRVLFIMEESVENTVPVKSLLNLLHLEHVFPMVIHQAFSATQLEAYVKKNEISHVCMIHREESDKRRMQEFPPFKADMYHTSCYDISFLLKDLFHTEHQSLHMFDRLRTLEVKHTLAAHG